MVVLIINSLNRFHKFTVESTSEVKIQKSSWSWEDPLKNTAESWSQKLERARKYQIIEVYTDISSAIDILESQDLDRQRQLTETLIMMGTTATEKEVRLAGLIGNTKWAEEDYHYIPLQLIEYAGNLMNDKEEYVFDSVHLDIEFYSTDLYQTDPKESVRQFTQLLKNSVKTVSELNSRRSNPLTLAFDISPNALNANWEALNDALLSVSEFKGNEIVLLAYRNKATGKGGVIDISKLAVSRLKSEFPNLEIVVGIETEYLEEKNISFFGTPISDLERELKSITTELQLSKVAVHTLEGYLNLPELTDK